MMSRDPNRSVHDKSVYRPFVGAVLEWWAANQRQLPWRDVRDPWLVLISEVMAQQTQVDRVVPKWEAFVQRFPDPSSCAEAPVSEVIEMWDGLGYNRRAVLLHRCAVEIVDRHHGVIPENLELLLALPGVGPYTARAVLAFAFEADVAVLDTNIGRILARLSGEPLGPVEAQRRADGLVPDGRGWAWNQALLDFSALVCSKRKPLCDACPVASACSWRGVGDDPAIGSASVGSAQSPFEGSDRQGRGRLVSALRSGPVDYGSVAGVMGWSDDPDRVDSVVLRLIADGLVERTGSTLHLLGSSDNGALGSQARRDAASYVSQDFSPGVTTT